MLAKSANLGLAENSKSNYRTAARHIQRCAEYTGIDMSLPFTIEKTLNYVGYLPSVRKVSHGTVDQYLSGVRMMHLCQNLDISSLRPPIVALILKGQQHWENIQNTINNKPKRIAVTLNIMKFIKRKLFELNWHVEKKLRVWAVCTLLWNGSLRVHEILSKEKGQFDPQTTCLAENLSIKKVMLDGIRRDVIQLHIKSPKEQRIGTDVQLEIFGNETFLCPVKALGKWLNKTRDLEKSCPVFRDSEGLCYTGAEFNKDLSEITCQLTEGTSGLIKPHSFRSGIATEMAQI